MMGLIFTLSHQPGNSISIPLPYHFDKVLHALIYGLLAATCLYAVLPITKPSIEFRLHCAIVSFCILYGVTDEWHQSFIPLRSPSLGDLLADGTGAAAMVFSWNIWQKKHRSKKSALCTQKI